MSFTKNIKFIKSSLIVGPRAKIPKLKLSYWKKLGMWSEKLLSTLQIEIFALSFWIWILHGNPTTGFVMGTTANFAWGVPAPDEATNLKIRKQRGCKEFVWVSEAFFCLGDLPSGMWLPTETPADAAHSSTPGADRWAATPPKKTPSIKCLGKRGIPGQFRLHRRREKIVLLRLLHRDNFKITLNTKLINSSKTWLKCLFLAHCPCPFWIAFSLACWLFQRCFYIKKWRSTVS